MGRKLLLMVISTGLLGVMISGLLPGIWYPLTLVSGAVAVAFGTWLLVTGRRERMGG